MVTVTAFEAKTRFGELLNRVSHGQEIVITRYDKAVARIIPEGRHGARQAAEAVEGLVALQHQISERSGGAAELSDADVRAAIEAGRP